MIPFGFQCKAFVLQQAFASGLELDWSDTGKPEFLGTESAWIENSRLMREALEVYGDSD